MSVWVSLHCLSYCLILFIIQSLTFFFFKVIMWVFNMPWVSQIFFPSIICWFWSLGLVEISVPARCPLWQLLLEKIERAWCRQQSLLPPHDSPKKEPPVLSPPKGAVLCYLCWEGVVQGHPSGNRLFTCSVCMGVRFSFVSSCFHEGFECM